MVSCSLLTVLLVSAVSAEITCITPRRTIPDNVSCDVALGHLARYLLPCLGRETVKVGEISAISDIILPIVFVDKDDHPPDTPRCAIEVFWRGPDDQYESIPPGMLQTFATNMKNQCIAPSPHRMARGLMEPSRWIYMLTELGYQSEGFEIGNLTTPEVNGTLVPVNRPRINPTDACTGVAESFDLVNLDGSQPSVESS